MSKHHHPHHFPPVQSTKSVELRCASIHVKSVYAISSSVYAISSSVCMYVCMEHHHRLHHVPPYRPDRPFSLAGWVSHNALLALTRLCKQDHGTCHYYSYVTLEILYLCNAHANMTSQCYTIALLRWYTNSTSDSDSTSTAIPIPVPALLPSSPTTSNSNTSYSSGLTWDPRVTILLQLLHLRSQRPAADGISYVNKSSSLFKPLLSGLNKQFPSENALKKLSSENKWTMHVRLRSTER